MSDKETRETSDKLEPGEGTPPTWPCPICNATGERVGQECKACDGEGEIIRGLYYDE